MSATEAWENEAITQFLPGDEWRETKAYRIHLLVTQDEEGTFSAVVLNLPGAGSCGDSPEEAIENAKEAALAAIESYQISGVEIPWKDSSSEKIPFGAVQKWFIVHG